MPAPTSPDPVRPASANATDSQSQSSPLERFARYRLLWTIAVVIYVLDQVTKFAIAARIPYPTYGPPGHIEVISGFFNLVHVGNTGAAWSILSGQGHWLALLAVVTLGAIYFWRHTLGLRSFIPQLCFGGLCGGTVGNLTDRVLHGHVVDFLDFHFGSYVYPSFNVADMGIVCGVFGYIIWSFKQPEMP